MIYMYVRMLVCYCSITIASFLYYNDFSFPFLFPFIIIFLHSLLFNQYGLFDWLLIDFFFYSLSIQFCLVTVTAPTTSFIQLSPHLL